jgi:hypothetical protein
MSGRIDQNRALIVERAEPTIVGIDVELPKSARWSAKEERPKIVGAAYVARHQEGRGGQRG